jgi:hypothetical protein
MGTKTERIDAAARVIRDFEARVLLFPQRLPEPTGIKRYLWKIPDSLQFDEAAEERLP